MVIFRDSISIGGTQCKGPWLLRERARQRGMSGHTHPCSCLGKIDSAHLLLGEAKAAPSHASCPGSPREQSGVEPAACLPSDPRSQSPLASPSQVSGRAALVLLCLPPPLPQNAARPGRQGRWPILIVPALWHSARLLWLSGLQMTGHPSPTLVSSAMAWPTPPKDKGWLFFNLNDVCEGFFLFAFSSSSEFYVRWSGT